LILATTAAGLAIRFAPLGLPSFVIKYGGSVFWAMLIYWIISSVLPSTRLLAVVILTCALTAAVELTKLHHSPGLDAFRLTLPGMLLLGRFFSLWDILAYWLAISIVFLIDSRIRVKIL
jgi:hypothetical protein